MDASFPSVSFRGFLDTSHNQVEFLLVSRSATILRRENKRSSIGTVQILGLIFSRSEYEIFWFFPKSCRRSSNSMCIVNSSSNVGSSANLHKIDANPNKLNAFRYSVSVYALRWYMYISSRSSSRVITSSISLTSYASDSILLGSSPNDCIRL